MKLRQFLCCCLAGGVFLSGGCPAAHAKERWVCVTMPHFKVLTPAPEQTARQWAVELEQFRALLQSVMSVPESQVRPLTVVMFRSDWAMRPYKPLENGKPKNVAGLFVNIYDSHAVEFSLDGDPKWIRRVIFHEAVHWYSNASEVALPAWLEEGVAEVYSTFRINSDGTGSLGGLIPEHLRLLMRDQRWPVRRLASTPTNSLHFNVDDQADHFYAESWLAAHYLLFGKGTPGRESINRYLKASATAASLEEAFRGAFGMDYEEFDGRLKTYLKGGHYTLYTYHLKPTAAEQMIQVRPAKEAEVELALGTLLLGARECSTPEGEAHLRRAAELAPTDATVWQVRGEAALLAQHLDEAGACFEQAIAHGSQSYFVYYGRAIARMQDMNGAGFMPDTAAAEKAMRELRRSLELNPRHLPAYEALASLIFAAPDYLSSDRALLERGRKLEPENPALEIGLAACDLKSGQHAEGRERLARLLAAPSRLTPEKHRLAQRIMHGDEWDVFRAELEQLIDKGSGREALARIDAAWDKFPDPQFRLFLKLNRRLVLAQTAFADAKSAMHQGDFARAGELLQRLLDTVDNPLVRREAERLLGELHKQEAHRTLPTARPAQ